MAISPARLLAFDILLRIETDNGFSSELLAANAESLGELDRSLCHELTLGVLRRQIYLDRVADQLSKGKRLDAEVRIALRLGLYQLLYLDRIPDYSAINESVELVRRAKKTSAKGFVNAILRRVTRERLDLAFSDEIDRISVETSHPRWLIEKWYRDLGPEECETTAAANNVQPSVAFRFTSRHRLGIHDASDLAATRSALVPGCFVADRFSPELRELESRHSIYFQDEASQLVASLALPNEGQRFLDVCAAPGGKTTLIADRLGANGKKALVVAGDISPRRTEFLLENCRSQGADNVRVARFDAEVALPFPDSSFDVVLVDAPCSGTGTLRHNPEIRYRLREVDFPDLAKRQYNILRNAAKLVVSGGRLVYSTCSLENEENESVVSAFVSDSDRFRIEKPDLPEFFVTPAGFARTYPARDNMDGFFVANLVRTADPVQ